MTRKERLQQQYTRALSVGLVLSVGIHVGVLAWGHMWVPEEAHEQRTVQLVNLAARDNPTPSVRLLQLQPTPPAPRIAASDPAGGSTGNPAAAVPLRTPRAPDPALLALPSGPALEPLVITDPLLAARQIKADLPIAEVDSIATPASPDPATTYVPGSVGAAKRRWAAAARGGDGQGGSGSGIHVGFGGGGGRGGVCGMPGHGKVPPPLVNRLTRTW